MSYTTVKCLECGKEFKQVTQHLIRKHNMTVTEYRDKYGENTPVWSQECLDRPSPMKGRSQPPEAREKIIKNLKTFKGEHKGSNIGISGLPVFVVSKKYLAVWVEGKNVLEHRYIMEKYLDRKLETWEHVHHIDRNTKNNEISNLEIITNVEHARMHMKEKRSNGTITGEHLKGLKNNPYGRRGKPKHG